MLNGCRIQIGGQVRGFEAEGRYNRQQKSLYDRFTQFTLAAAAEAIAQSGITFSGETAAKSGVVLGTAGGGVSTWDDNYRAVYEDGKNRVHPFVVPKLMNNAAASHVSMEYNLKGPFVLPSRPLARRQITPMAQAFQMVRTGMAPAMVTGGSESMLCFGGVKAWERLAGYVQGRVSPVFRPTATAWFRARVQASLCSRNMNTQSCVAPNILCEVAGFAMSSDASDIVMPQWIL